MCGNSISVCLKTANVKKHEAELDKLNKKRSNPGFLAKAPENGGGGEGAGGFPATKKASSGGPLPHHLTKLSSQIR